MIRGGSARAATIRSAPQIEGDPGHEPEEARIAGRIVMSDTAPGVRRDHHLVRRGELLLSPPRRMNNPGRRAGVVHARLTARATVGNM